MQDEARVCQCIFYMVDTKDIPSLASQTFTSHYACNTLLLNIGPPLSYYLSSSLNSWAKHIAFN